MAQEVKLTTDGLLLNWLKSVGESVKAGEIIAELEADKATVEVEADSDGVLVELRAEIGEELKEGDVIAVIGAQGEASASAPKAEASAPAETAPAEEAPAASASNGAPKTSSVTADGRIKASPLAKRVAADKGIDLATVEGSGPGGRIVKADVESGKPATKAAPAASAPASAPTGSFAQSYGKLPEASDDVEIIDISRMRKAIAEGTTRSKQSTPHFYVTVEIDVEPLLALRKQLNDSLSDEGVKISVNDMLVKATALTLRKFPNLNSHYYGDKLVRYKNINIAISVALPNNGLVNVVSPNADQVALSTLAERHKEVFERVRDGKIKTEDLKGGTFGISNLGPFDVDSFIAIIDPPQSGMLAVSSAKKIPVVKSDGTIGVGQRMKVTLSIDHRVSDGAEGAQWLKYFRELVENPMRLLV